MEAPETVDFSPRNTREWIIYLHGLNKTLVKLSHDRNLVWQYNNNCAMIRNLRERLILFLRLASDTRNFYKNKFSVQPDKLDKDNHFSVNLQ